MTEITVLYDGWDLVYRPNHPGALHLLAVLGQRPAQARALVALPGESLHHLAEAASLQQIGTPDNPAGRLRWEQRVLPALLRDLNADLLHLTSGGPPLFGRTRSVVSPIWMENRAFAVRQGSSRSLAARLREALAQGGLTRAQGLFWPEDLPESSDDSRVFLLPPVIPGGFHLGPSNGTQEDIDWDCLAEFLPGFDENSRYVLYHGPTTQEDLYRLFDSWSWAAGSIGVEYPLCVVGLDKTRMEIVQEMFAGNGLLDTVRLIPPLPLACLAAVYQQASVLFHPAEVTPWGNPVRLALAGGKPVVGMETALMDALVGAAGYLIPPDENGQVDQRLMGAALLTVLVEENLAQDLSSAALLRTRDWGDLDFPTRLHEAYQAILA